MTITFSQVTKWAALMPPVGISTKAKFAWRRFVPLELDGKRVAFPAKAALAWMESRGAESMAFEVDARMLRGKCGNSRINLCVYTSSIPCEEPGASIRDRCEWTDMTVDGKTSSTADERKAANHAKRLDKAKRDWVEAKKALDNETARANRHKAAVTIPFKDTVKQARLYLSVMRLRRAYERNPTAFPSWMPETCQRDHFDCDTQSVVTREHKTRDIHDELLANLSSAKAEQDAYKPRKTKWGTPIYGPKWDKLTEAVKRAEQDLLRFLESSFREHIRAQGIPDGVCYTWIGDDLRPYSRARIYLKTWPIVQADLESKLAEAGNRLNKAEPGWQYWHKNGKASWVHEREADKLAKARELGAECIRIEAA